MFKKVTSHKGFWKSVATLTLALCCCVLFDTMGLLLGFSAGFLNVSLRTVVALLLGGFVYGFSMTYGKFWGKLKEKATKNK